MLANPKFIKCLSLSVILFLIDQLSKFLVINNSTLSSGSQISIIDPILVLKKIENKGIAFGIDGNGDFSYVFTPLTIILTLAIIVYLYKTSNKNSSLMNLSLSLILGGALGNLFDRIFSGEVVDFIALFENIFPFIFNLADTFITVGMVMLLASDLIINKNRKNEKESNKNI
ncbi:MAG: signal peptidase II [Candidatus Marinimicrobia bacterium]|nr:signal peptidase II [Candidatus Neomarinimicrobiota bacterium]|tara:strand:- start:330 stop:845 length:516 start_codon:yes stop_codon:yes gene_type:complete